MKAKSYYNTVNLKKLQLKLAEYKAAGQNVLVRMLFKFNPSKRFTPLEVYDILTRNNIISDRVPESSIKRAVTVNKVNDWIIKTEDMKIERYGAPNHYYIFNKNKSK